jgi:hypothetical protein
VRAATEACAVSILITYKMIGGSTVYKYLVIFALLIQSPAAVAILNIESERPSLPEEGFSGSLKLGINGKTGNQEETSNEGGAKIFYRADNEILMALIEKAYSTLHKTKITDSRFLHARWIHLLDKPWAVEGFVQSEEDEFDNLTSRILAGGGGRYLVAQQKDLYLMSVGFGAFREIEKLNLVTYEETNRLWRINSYYSYKYKLNDQVSLVNTAYFQPSVRNGSDYRVLFDLGFAIKLTNSLKLNVNYKLSYDSQPAKNLAATPPIDNFNCNTEYKTALSYSF